MYDVHNRITGETVHVDANSATEAIELHIADTYTSTVTAQIDRDDTFTATLSEAQ